MFLKFKTKSDFLAWDKQQFLEFVASQESDPSAHVVECAKSCHGVKVMYKKNGVINTKTGAVKNWTACVRKDGSDEVITRTVSARNGHAQKALTEYGAVEITRDQAIRQGFIQDFDEDIA